MAGIVLMLIAVCILASMAIAYFRSRDPLHPLMYLGPMLLYVFVLRPGLLLSRGQLQELLTGEQIVFAELLFAAGVAFFCYGVLAGGRNTRGRIHFDVTPGMRRRMVSLATWLGVAANLAYNYAIFRSGGYLSVYSRAKGSFSAGSGWVNELVNLSVPAAALLILAWGGRRTYRHYAVWAVLAASPLWIHGLLGARRGPTFIVLASVLVAWYISSPKRVSIWKVTTRFGTIGVIVLLLLSNRGNIYIGSDEGLEASAVLDVIAPEEVGPADDTVNGYGFVNGVTAAGNYYWGARYFATYFVRPIPRQLWPTKYEDLGLGWMVQQDSIAGIEKETWIETLGWMPVRGSAVGFVADLFSEFSWFGLLGCGMLGWFYGALWRRASRRSGVWTLLYVKAAALSVYIPTQSVSAVFHRFLFMGLFTVLLWKVLVGKSSATPQANRGRLDDKW